MGDWRALTVAGLALALNPITAIGGGIRDAFLPPKIKTAGDGARKYIAPGKSKNTVASDKRRARKLKNVRRHRMAMRGRR